MYKLLRNKGYKGTENIYEVLQWLETKNIYVDFITVWDEQNPTQAVGKRVQFYCPPYRSVYGSAIMLNYKDAFEFMIFKCADYL